MHGVEEAGAGVDLGAAVEPGLGDVDARRLGLDRRIERVADRDAVEAVIMIDREADIVLARDPGCAGGDVPGFRGAVRQAAANIGERADIRVGAGQRLGAERGDKRVAADFEIVGL